MLSFNSGLSQPAGSSVPMSFTEVDEYEPGKCPYNELDEGIPLSTETPLLWVFIGVAYTGAELGAKCDTYGEAEVEPDACALVWSFLGDAERRSRALGLRIEPVCLTDRERGLVAWTPLSSSSHAPMPSSTSSSFASDITTTSAFRARLPCSISMASLSPIQSIWIQSQWHDIDHGKLRLTLSSTGASSSSRPKSNSGRGLCWIGMGDACACRRDFRE